MLVVDLCSSLVYFLMTHPFTIAGKLPIKSLDARQLPIHTHTHTHIHAYTRTHIHIILCNCYNLCVYTCTYTHIHMYTHQSTHKGTVTVIVCICITITLWLQAWFIFSCRRSQHCGCCLIILLIFIIIYRVYMREGKKIFFFTNFSFFPLAFLWMLLLQD